MGSLLSPILADIYMEHFEQMAIETAQHQPSPWVRYVDDIFVIWSHSRNEVNEFLTHLNSLKGEYSVYDGTREGWQTSLLGCHGEKTATATEYHGLHKTCTYRSLSQFQIQPSL